MSLLASILATSPAQAEAAAQQVGDAAQAAAGAAQTPQVDWTKMPWSTEGTFWLPERASITVDNVDWLFYGVLGLSIFCFVGVTAAVVYFTWKYRARPGHEVQPSATHNDTLEITWTIIPAIICVFLFVFGWRGYIDSATPPRHAEEVQVVAKKWSWTFIYPNGGTDNVLHVPVGEPVRLIMTSDDVLHSFFVPAFRIKQDVVPRRYTQVWFEATHTGVFRLYCTEYCGQDHSLMKTLVVVHEAGDYQAYLESLVNQPVGVERGEKTYNKFCVSCHTVDGSPRVGPTFKGMFGTERELADGTKAVADENYILESIRQPQAKIRKGFPPSMTPFDERSLKDDDIRSLIMYFKTLQ